MGVEDREASGSAGSSKIPHVRSISTGSVVFDSLLGGGLPVSSVTDVYGAAATGKTQFAFQNTLMTCANAPELHSSKNSVGKPAAVFIDCAGSFRPERITEIADSRGFNPAKILDLISSIHVRSVHEQLIASNRVYDEDKFSKCRLLVVDDITTNFVSELNQPEQIIERQSLLSLYARRLSQIAIKRGLSVLLTNSIRSRGEIGEGETTGEILSQYALFRLMFRRVDRTRIATVEQPLVSRKEAQFRIETLGIP